MESITEMIKVRMNQDRNFIPIKNSLFTIPQVSCFFIVRIEERIKIKFYAKIRLYKLPAFTTSTNRHRKFQIPMIYNMNILGIFFEAHPKHKPPVSFSTDHFSHGCFYIELKILTFINKSFSDLIDFNRWF